MHYKQQTGAVLQWLLALLAVFAAAGVWLWLDDDAGKSLKRGAELHALAVIGDAAAKRMSAMGAAGEGTHGSAVDLIARPIEIRQISPRVHYATGVGNTVMVTTSDGVVIFDTGLALQSAQQLRLLKKQVSDAPVRYVVLSHSHADHIGGAKLWPEAGTRNDYEIYWLQARIDDTRLRLNGAGNP